MGILWGGEMRRERERERGERSGGDQCSESGEEKTGVLVVRGHKEES